MTAPSCCDNYRSDCSNKDAEQVNCFKDGSGFLKRFLHLLRWMFTGSVIILLPKCPFCLAAYIAMATGIGLSFPVASLIRVMLIILCIISLSSFAARHIYIYYNKEQPNLSSGNHHYKANLLALKLSVISSLYYLIIGA